MGAGRQALAEISQLVAAVEGCPLLDGRVDRADKHCSNGDERNVNGRGSLDRDAEDGDCARENHEASFGRSLPGERSPAVPSRLLSVNTSNSWLTATGFTVCEKKVDDKLAARMGSQAKRGT
jgi:hypothetical protein